MTDPLEPDQVIDCIDCGGRAHLMTRPGEFGWQEGEIVLYRCEDCLDRWDLLVGPSEGGGD